MTGIFDRIRHRLAGSPADSAGGRSSGFDEPSGEDLALRLSSMPGYRVLREVDANAGVERLRATVAGERIAAVVDTETTGLDPTTDRIIEIAIQRMIFDGGRRILEIERARSWLEDPQRPLSADISRLTGLFDRDLCGQRFDDEAILEMVGASEIVIAHNALFDRPFLDRRFPSLSDFPWACSLSQLDWRDLGFDGRALGHLVLQSGWFFHGHRAGNDTSAELPPSEWSIDYESLDQGRDDECLPRSTSPRRSSGSCVRLRSCWARAGRPRRHAAGSRSASRLTTAGARNMVA